jgi:hypothetical protein
MTPSFSNRRGTLCPAGAIDHLQSRFEVRTLLGQQPL